MKIVILAPTHRSFISRHLTTYSENELPEGYFGAPIIGLIISELLNLGHEVVSITTTPTSNGKFDVKEFSFNKFKWIVVPARKNSFKFNGRHFGRMVDFFFVERQLLKRAVLREEPDFIHAHWSYEFAGCLSGIQIPHLITVHDNAYEVFRYCKTLYRFLRLVMSEVVLRNVRFASTVSPYMEAYVKKRCGEVMLIPNPAEFKYDFGAIQEMVRKKVENLGNPKLIMVMNGWSEVKNGKSAFIAFKLMLIEYPNATLHIFGHGSESKGVAEACATALDVHGIFFHGPVDNATLLRHMEDSHVLIHPSREESFGVVLIEAMSLGVPTVGGDTSGAVPWVIGNPQLLANILKPDNIKNTIVKLIENPGEYFRISLSCYENTLKRFSVESVVKSYNAYYYEIIKKWS
jgi:glycosyltransferase involved in cell wall biosynthesis